MHFAFKLISLSYVFKQPHVLQLISLCYIFEQACAPHALKHISLSYIFEELHALKLISLCYMFEQVRAPRVLKHISLSCIFEQPYMLILFQISLNNCIHNRLHVCTRHIKFCMQFICINSNTSKVQKFSVKMSGFTQKRKRMSYAASFKLKAVEAAEKM